MMSEAAVDSWSSQRLLDLDPDLCSFLSAEARRRLSTVRLPVAEIGTGPFNQHQLRAPGRTDGRPLALLVLKGVVKQRLELGQRRSAALFGPGDVIVSIDRGSLPLPVAGGLAAETECRIALLDDRFLAACETSPRLFERLFGRAMTQQHEAFLLQAVSQLPRMEDRLLAVLWHLAERWGTVGPDGVDVGVRLTHEALAELAGGRRPTVSLGLRLLTERGHISATSQGRWRLAPASVTALTAAGAPHERPWMTRPGRVDGPAPPVTAVDRSRMRARLRALRDEHQAQSARLIQALDRSEHIQRRNAANRVPAA